MKILSSAQLNIRYKVIITVRFDDNDVDDLTREIIFTMRVENKTFFPPTPLPPHSPFLVNFFDKRH